MSASGIFSHLHFTHLHSPALAMAAAHQLVKAHCSMICYIAPVNKLPLFLFYTLSSCPKFFASSVI